MSKSKVDKISLVEGSTRNPKIQILISEYIGDKDLSKEINLDKDIACGATIHSGTLSGELIDGKLIKLMKKVANEIFKNMEEINDLRRSLDCTI